MGLSFNLISLKYIRNRKDMGAIAPYFNNRYKGNEKTEIVKHICIRGDISQLEMELQNLVEHLLKY